MATRKPVQKDTPSVPTFDPAAFTVETFTAAVLSLIGAVVSRTVDGLAGSSGWCSDYRKHVRGLSASIIFNTTTRTYRVDTSRLDTIPQIPAEHLNETGAAWYAALIADALRNEYELIRARAAYLVNQSVLEMDAANRILTEAGWPVMERPEAPTHVITFPRLLVYGGTFEDGSQRGLSNMRDTFTAALPAAIDALPALPGLNGFRFVEETPGSRVSAEYAYTVPPIPGDRPTLTSNPTES